VKIAIFSPLNPVKSGISDYTEEMLEKLAKYFEIDLYIDQGYWPENKSILSSFKIIPFDPDTFDPSVYSEIVYHMGNYYKAHHYIYESLKKFPGIVVLHDYVLQGFYAERYKANRDFSQYRNLQVKYYGIKGEEIASQISDHSRIPIWESDMGFNYPLNEEIVEYAKGIIVHSDFVKQRIQAKTEKPVVKILHHSHELKQFNKADIRKKLGLKEGEILLCSVGFINKNKRFSNILAAMDEIEGLRLKYIIAGEDKGKLLDNYLQGGNPDIIVKGYLPIEELERLIAAADICINLRYPTMGESSGSLLRMMSYGKPTLVTNYGSYAEFPDYCLLKINPDIYEKEMIKRFILALAWDEDFRCSVGREAHEYVKSECSIEKCAKEYASFITELKKYE